MTPDEQAKAAELLGAILTGSTREGHPVKVAEHVTLRKYAGNGTDGELLETVHIRDGAIVERIIHKEA